MIEQLWASSVTINSNTTVSSLRNEISNNWWSLRAAEYLPGNWHIYDRVISRRSRKLEDCLGQRCKTSEMNKTSVQGFTETGSACGEGIRKSGSKPWWGSGDLERDYNVTIWSEGKSPILRSPNWLTGYGLTVVDSSTSFHSPPPLVFAIVSFHGLPWCSRLSCI